ncbi:MAG: hypothetical protein RR197_00720, partial [Oscillospiraceae bacterium]
MTLNECKFAASEFAGQDIASLPDRPSEAGITAAQLKARFDNVGKVLLALGKHNLLIDTLTALEIERLVVSGTIKAIRLNADRQLETTADGTTWTATGSSGHVILDQNGTAAVQRSRMKFSNCLVTDDGTNTVINGVTGPVGPIGPQGTQGIQGIQGPEGRAFV